MKKIILTEICLIILTAALSTGLYHIFYGIDLSYNNYFDMLLFEVWRAYLFYAIFSNFFLPIYLAINLGRLIYFKFQKLYITAEITIAAILWISAMFLHYRMLCSDSIGPAKEGWTVYPPLSAIPNELSETDTVRLGRDKTLLLIKMCAIFTATFVLAAVTIRRRKKYRP
jgi:hypothetical protein